MNFASSRSSRSLQPRKPCAALALLVGAVGPVLLGCAGTGSNQADPSTHQREGRAIFAPLPGSTGTNRSTTTEPQTAWSIAIANFPRTTQGQSDAQHALGRVTTVGRLSGARLEPRNKRIVLLFGLYSGPDDPAAARDLKRVRAIEVTSPSGLQGRPYASAILSPPSFESHPGTIPRFDLNNARASNPRALYTLQIGIYGNLDRVTRPTNAELVEIRRAAEEAVNILRRDGELAFYYHGPTRSTVTVGIFTQTDYDPYPPQNRPPVESPRVRHARVQHPHNLLNGSGIRRKIPGTDGTRPAHFRLEPSFIIALPK